MTNYELQQLAVEWLRQFARENDATREGKHAAVILRFVGRTVEARDDGWNAAIEAAVKALAAASGRSMSSVHAERAEAIVTALAKPESQPSRVEHRGALAFDDDAYCSSEECWCQRMELGVKDAMTGGGK